MGRAPCCDKTKVKRGPWSPEEDVLLKNYITKNGTGGNWISLPQRAGLNRCGKSCRLRWLNYLRPDIKHGGFTEQEDCVICTLYIAIGSRWSVIASKLPGRTDNDVKNYWNTKLRKKILAGQVAGFTTHQPPMIYNHMTNNNHYPNGSSDLPPLQDEHQMYEAAASFSAHNGGNVGLTTPLMQVQQPSLNYHYYYDNNNSCWVQEEDKKVGIAEEKWVPQPQAKEINNMNWEPAVEEPLLSQTVSPSAYYHDIPSGSGQLSASLSSSGATTRASSSSSSSAALSEETNSFGGCSSSSWALVGSRLMDCKLEESNVVEGGECFWTRLLETNYHHHHMNMIVGGSQQLEQKIHEFASVLDDY